MRPQGICLQEDAEVIYPDGSTRKASIWQHTSGAQSIYAAVLDTTGEIVTFLGLEPQWNVMTHEGDVVYQGMSPSITLPVRLLAWLIFMRLALLVPGCRAIGVGDLVRVSRRSHPFYGQVVKVRSAYGDGYYWLEQEVSPRWRTGIRIAGVDLVRVKYSRGK